MILKFKVYELVENPKYIGSHEFIKVGEVIENGENYFLLQNVDEGELKLIEGLDIQQSAYRIKSDIVKLKGDETYSNWYEFDISKKYLNKNILKELKRLN